jgi:hypothetical protein
MPFSFPIRIGNENGINAGMSGRGNSDSDIRIWAGAAKEDKSNAPFRVQHNGKVVMSNADVTGKVTATDGEFNGKVAIAGNKILLNKDGSGRLASGNVAWDIEGNVTIAGKINSNLLGKRVVIDPSDDKKIKFYDAKDNEMASFGFYDDSAMYPDSGILFGEIKLNHYFSNQIRRQMTVSPRGIKLFDFDSGQYIINLE